MNKAPLSPHLQIYKLPLNALMSITHRITGAILGIVFLACIAVLVALAMGEKSYQIVDPLLSSWPFVVLVNAAVLVLFYHLLNGIKHLFMDRLMGLGKQQSRQSSLLVLVFTALFFIVWLVM